QVPAFGHLPLVRGEGNKKLSKRDPESNLFTHRARGFIPEGLLNYLALLGWAIAPDRDIFTREELIAAFDIADVNPNPARFDLKKAEAINAAHVRLLEQDDLAARIVPYLHEAELVSASTWAELTAAEQGLLTEAVPLIQERMVLLGEAVGMLGFFFRTHSDLQREEDAVKALRPEAAEVLDTAIELLDRTEDFAADHLQQVLRDAIVEGMGIKPRFAFAPLRVAISGRRVSPPLFESMEILGKEETMARLRALRAELP
ncbi:MAG TPA: glutamate--tRNA ligase family protein, partial [Beutenbergiaceae bacterium]|nr:glutamate--tRNA ligase family protein [Beutenbergiaceae bacterium]